MGFYGFGSALIKMALDGAVFAYGEFKKIDSQFPHPVVRYEYSPLRGGALC